MGFFGVLFWVVLAVLLTSGWRRRCWERPHQRSFHDEEAEVQRSHIEALESRVLQLEERLDFTERLLASRSMPGVASDH